MEDQSEAFAVGIWEASGLSSRESPRMSDLRYSARAVSQSVRPAGYTSRQPVAPYPSPGRGVSGESSN